MQTMTPRPTFHDLRWLLAGLALTFLPLGLYLPWWVTASAFAIGLWRYRLAALGKALPPKPLLVLLVVAGAGGMIATYHHLFGRDASTALAMLMVALKLMESQARRDFIVEILLAFFIGITVFQFSQSLLMGAYLLLPVFTLTAALIGVNHPGGTLAMAPRLRMAGAMLGQAAPVMLALFLLFPRVPGPLWGAPEDAFSGMSGLSDHMSPGSISQLSLSDAAAFRAEFKGDIPAPQQRYWRGPVFWQFDGRTWSGGKFAANLPPERVGDRSAPIEYTVTLEPHNLRWLFLLDLPESAPPGSIATPDLQLLAQAPVRTRLRYQAASSLQYRLAATLAPAARRLALQLPTNGNPRTRALGAEWAASGQTPEALAQRALALFRDQAFSYTLRPPLLGQDSVDEFLFTTRRGFCEHYAGSFVFLMRAAGVPARVVTGYQGGQVNPVGRYLIVRQADAHAWAEVWLEGRGWVRIDPTAAVSPQRVESGIASALPAGEPLPMLARGDAANWLRAFYLNWDALNNGWNQWVLGYNEKKQLELFSRIVGSAVSWQDLALWLMLAVGVIVLGITLAIMRSVRLKTDALGAAWSRFQHKLARAGVERLPHEGPLDYGRRAAAALPGRSQQIRQITAHYARLRYGRRAATADLLQFKREVRNFTP